MSEHDHLVGPTPVPPPSPWNIANALTVLRILLVPVLVVALLEKTHNGDLVAAFVFALASATDFSW